MATITELFESGVGDTVTVGGEASVSRMFLVVVDAPKSGQRETPADVVLRDKSLGASAVPVGSPHPGGWDNDRAGLVASKYTIEEHIDYLTYRVRVEYAPRINFTMDAGEQWTFSYSSGFGTKQLASILATQDPVTGQLLDPPQVVDIGPHVYDENKEGHYVTTASNKVRKWVLVENKRRIQPVEFTYPIGTMTLTRQLRNYTAGLHTYLLQQRNRINDDQFLTRPPGTLKFVGPNVQSQFALAPNSDQRGVIWDISLTFEDNEEGWFHVLYDTWIEPDTGEEVAVIDERNNEIQWQRYKLYLGYGFGNMLSVVNAYA